MISMNFEIVMTKRSFDLSFQFSRNSAILLLTVLIYLGASASQINDIYIFFCTVWQRIMDHQKAKITLPELDTN